MCHRTTDRCSVKSYRQGSSFARRREEKTKPVEIKSKKKVDEKMSLSHRHMEFCGALMGGVHVIGLLLSNTAAK